jgi:twitching motility protein PilT
MRDLETIQTALTLAETGHLVLGTLHTGDATQALTRIIDVYPPHQQTQARTQLSLVLIGIMVQQLLRKRDGTGRCLAYEILTGTPAVANMIRSGEVQQIYTAIQTGANEGMCTLNSSLLRLYRARAISRDDAIQKSARQKELLEQLDGFR